MTTAPRPVLVVDDEEAIRATVLEALDFEGYPATAAADGAEALRAVESKQPCVILLDMRMPVMDGWAFARAYRDRPEPRAPVVVMTAAENAQRWADEIHADAILPKPFDLDQLYAVVARWCRSTS